MHRVLGLFVSDGNLEMFIVKNYGPQCNQLTAFIGYVRRPACPIAAHLNKLVDVLCARKSVDLFRMISATVRVRASRSPQYVGSQKLL